MIKKQINIAEPVTGEAEWQAVKHPIESGWLTQGPKVAEFERKFAEYHDVPHALATTSCTTALHLILAAMEIGPGDEVLLPAFSWVASANVILYCGATPVFVDIDPATYNIAPDKIAEKVTANTKAIIIVHLFGLCADVDSIKAVLPDHVKIVEDAACAAGAQYKGKFAGGLGDAAAFSFHPRKIITTGEGGMVTTKDATLADRMTKMRNHGAEISEEQRHHGPKPYLLPDFNMLGFNYRMTDLQGAVGVVQLTKLSEFIKQRNEIAKYYLDALNEVKWLQLPRVNAGYSHSWQAFVAKVLPEHAPAPRNDIMDSLAAQGIATRPGTHAIHMLNYFQSTTGYKDFAFPNARDCNNHSLAIPLHNNMTLDDCKYVVAGLRGI